MALSSFDTSIKEEKKKKKFVFVVLSNLFQEIKKAE